MRAASEISPAAQLAWRPLQRKRVWEKKKNPKKTHASLIGHASICHVWWKFRRPALLSHAAYGTKKPKEQKAKTNQREKQNKNRERKRQPQHLHNNRLCANTQCWQGSRAPEEEMNPKEWCERMCVHVCANQCRPDKTKAIQLSQKSQ